MKIHRDYIVGFLLLLLAVVSYFVFFYKADKYEGTVQHKSSSKSDNSKLLLKSVIVSMKSAAKFAGSDIYSKIYIDNYGENYCTVTDTKLEYQGIEIVSSEISIVKEGFTYTYNPEKKAGVKSVNTENFNPTKINFAGLDYQTMQDHGIENAGTEVILGRECDVYTIANPALKMSGRYVVWQTIPLRSKTVLDDLNIEMIATKIEENVSIPSKFFEIPKDIKFTQPSGDVTELSLPSPSKTQ